MKPGIKSTEFWISIATAIWGALQPALPAWAHVIVPAAVTIGYTLSRGLAKSNPNPSAGAAAFTTGNP